MAVIKVDENDPIGEVEPSFPFRDVKIMHNVDVRDYYDLKEEIGRGKFGTVYRCTEKKTGVVLAAKFVAIAKKQDRINVEREVEIMRTLQHPRLIQLYDSFEIQNVMCVVLELIEGGELFERVIDDDFILTEKACAIFMRQICEGVGFIHDNKIIHLDLKPENILCLTKTGNRIKIIDFGLARKYDPNKKLQVLFGTPEFVAPEVVNFDEITTATDMWSVGVICYVLLSGLSPFMGENDLQTMTNVTMAQYDFDDESFDSISADAKDFISKLLVKNKEKRLSAGSTISHPWLKRKPPPPPMFLETSKENLKSYVDNNHGSSPFLLVEALSNGSINDDQLSATTEPIEKTVKLYNLTPELSLPQSEKTLSEELTIKLKNEMNLEKSNNLNTITLINKDQPIASNEKSSNLPEINAPTSNIDTESISRKVLIKTDSFKELPRKFSVTFSDGSRELPRRSSLTRADKAKNEIKRETFVSFVGPKEIKPIDPLSPEVKNAVEELTKFIKANFEEVIEQSDVSSKIVENSIVVENKTVEAIKKEHFALTEDLSKAKKEESQKSLIGFLRDETARITEEINSAKTVKINAIDHLSQNQTIQYKPLKEHPNRINEVTPLLRPAEYLKLTNNTKEISQTKTGPTDYLKLSNNSNDTIPSKAGPTDYIKFSTNLKDNASTKSGPVDYLKSTNNPKDTVSTKTGPADYLKSTNNPKDTVSTKTGPADYLKPTNNPKDTVSTKPGPADYLKLTNTSKDNTHTMSKTGSADCIKLTNIPKDITRINTNPADYLKFANNMKEAAQTKTGLCESRIHSAKSIDKNIVDIIEKKSSGSHSHQSSCIKDVLSSKQTHISSINDNKGKTSSSRSQTLLDINKKPTDKHGKEGVVSSSLERTDSLHSACDTFSMKVWHPTTMRNDLSLPRKCNYSIRQDSTESKESISHSVDNRTSRATSLDPSSTGNSTTEQPFHSRFLKSSLLRSESSSRCSSEAPTNKYEEFRNRYSNYKELATDNDKLFKKSYIDRTLPKKKENIDDTQSVTKGETTSQSSNKSINQSSSTSHLLTSTGFLSRQKFKLTEQQRDVPYMYKSQKSESSSSAFKVGNDKYYSRVCGMKESTSIKHSQNTTQNSESKSKLTINEKSHNSQKSS